MQQEIARTIAAQINHSAGNPLFMGCAGAKNLVFLNRESIIEPGKGIRGGLMFRATASPGAKVIVELDASDTYTVQIGRTRGVNYRVIDQFEGIHADTLAQVIAPALKLTDFCYA